MFAQLDTPLPVMSETGRGWMHSTTCRWVPVAHRRGPGALWSCQAERDADPLRWIIGRLTAQLTERTGKSMAGFLRRQGQLPAGRGSRAGRAGRQEVGRRPEPARAAERVQGSDDPSLLVAEVRFEQGGQAVQL